MFAQNHARIASLIISGVIATATASSASPHAKAMESTGVPIVCVPSPSVLSQGTDTTITVSVNQASSTPQQVAITSTDGYAFTNMPSAVSIAPYQTTTQFTIHARIFQGGHKLRLNSEIVTITATANGQSLNTNVTIN